MNFKQTRDNVIQLLTDHFTTNKVTKSAYFGDFNLDANEIQVSVLPKIRQNYTDGTVVFGAKFSVRCRGAHTKDVDVNADNSITLATSVLAFLATKLSFKQMPGIEIIQLALYSDFSVCYDVQFMLGYDYAPPGD